MNTFAPSDVEPSVARRAAASNVSAELQVDRLMSLAFFPGRTPRSNAYREGCMAALEYHIRGQKMPLAYAAGTSEADAWSAGVAEGQSIAKAGAATRVDATTPAEQRLLESWRAMDDRSQGFIGKLVIAQAKDCPRRPEPYLRLLKSS